MWDLKKFLYGPRDPQDSKDHLFNVAVFLHVKSQIHISGYTKNNTWLLYTLSLTTSCLKKITKNYSRQNYN